MSARGGLSTEAWKFLEIFIWPSIKRRLLQGLRVLLKRDKNGSQGRRKFERLIKTALSLCEIQQLIRREWEIQFVHDTYSDEVINYILSMPSASDLF